VQALGCVLFRLAFFDHPFEDGANLQIINAVYQIPTNSRFSTQLHDVIRTCLTKELDERPTSAELLAIVKKAKASKPVSFFFVHFVMPSFHIRLFDS
jgi:serine/threonine protein kinase